MTSTGTTTTTTTTTLTASSHSSPNVRTLSLPLTAFACHSPVSVSGISFGINMAGKLATSSHTKRKPSITPPSSSPKTRSSRSPVTTFDTAKVDERSQRGGSKYGKFSYPERRIPSRSENAMQPGGRTHRASSNKHYVFVYGTLKKGFANAHFLERATCLGEFRTVTRYPLVVGGKYHSPYLLDMPSNGSKVKGEMYAVDDATLADLDYLENVGVNYTRRVDKVTNCADRSFVADAYMYFKTNGLEELARKEFMDDYQCRRYVPRHMREKVLVGGASASRR